MFKDFVRRLASAKNYEDALDVYYASVYDADGKVTQYCIYEAYIDLKITRDEHDILRALLQRIMEATTLTNK